MLLKRKEELFFTVGWYYLLFIYKTKMIVVYYTKEICYVVVLLKNKISGIDYFFNFRWLTYLYRHFIGIDRSYFYELMLEGLYYRVKFYRVYRCLAFILGYNHYILYFIPKKVQIKCHAKRRRFLLYGFDRGLLGRVAVELVNLKYPNLFKGRGVKIESFDYRRKIVIKKK